MSKNNPTPIDVEQVDAHGRHAQLWIVEPISGKTAPYSTYRPEIAIKRAKAGDLITPYFAQLPPQEDEL